MISRRAFALSIPSLALAGRAFARGKDVPERACFGGARFRFPNRNSQVFAASGNLAVLSDITFVTPNFPTRDHRFLYSGYWFENGDLYEVRASNAFPVAASMSIAGSAFMRLPVHGSNCFTVNPDQNIWTDRGIDSLYWTPPSTPINIRTLTWLPDGAYRIGGITPNTGPLGYKEGCVISNDYTQLIGLLDSPEITYNTFGANAAMVAPSMCVCRSVASNRSILVPGDSIAHDKTAITYDANNNRGHMARGLHNAGFAVNDIAFSGARLSTEASNGPLGSMVKRAEALSMLPERPFDSILLDTGTNDIIAPFDLAAMCNLYTAEVTRFRSLFGSDVRIVLQTMLPRTTGTFDSASGQTPKAGCNGPNSLMYQMNQLLRAPSNFGADGCLDLGPIMAAQNNPNPDDPADVWRYDGGASTVDGTHLTDHGSDIATVAVTQAALSGVI